MRKHKKLVLGLNLDFERIANGGIWSFFDYFEQSKGSERIYGVLILFIIIGYKTVDEVYTK